MPNQHKNPKLGWNPPSERAAWVRKEAARRRVDLSQILNEALVSAEATAGHAVFIVVCADGGHGAGGKVIAENVTVTEAMDTRGQHRWETAHTDCWVMLQAVWEHLTKTAAMDGGATS